MISGLPIFKLNRVVTSGLIIGQGCFARLGSKPGYMSTINVPKNNRAVGVRV